MSDAELVDVALNELRVAGLGDEHRPVLEALALAVRKTAANPVRDARRRYSECPRRRSLCDALIHEIESGGK